jgi:toxin YoeB
MRTLKFTDEGWDSYVYWQTQDVQRDPFAGIGKPEPLKHGLSGCWSRRIDESNRFVYMVNDVELIVISCRYHY